MTQCYNCENDAEHKCVKCKENWFCEKHGDIDAELCDDCKREEEEDDLI